MRAMRGGYGTRGANASAPPPQNAAALMGHDQLVPRRAAGYMEAASLASAALLPSSSNTQSRLVEASTSDDSSSPMAATTSGAPVMVSSTANAMWAGCSFWRLIFKKLPPPHSASSAGTAGAATPSPCSSSLVTARLSAAGTPPSMPCLWRHTDRWLIRVLQTFDSSLSRRVRVWACCVQRADGGNSALIKAPV